MLDILWKSGDKERVIDLVEAPEIVLLTFCEMILREQDLRNPDARYMLRGAVNALKVKTEKLPDCPDAYSRHRSKECIARIEDLLDQYESE